MFYINFSLFLLHNVRTMRVSFDFFSLHNKQLSGQHNIY